jgi:hypothetical protein
MSVANGFFEGSGTTVLTIEPAASSASAVCARGKVEVNPWRSIDFTLAASSTDRFGLGGGVILRGKNYGGWSVRSMVITDLHTAQVDADADSAEITATGYLFRGHRWGHHGHGHPGHHGPWPDRRSGAGGHRFNGTHDAYGHHGSVHHDRRHVRSRQAVTVRIYVEDAGWGRPSPDAIWIGVYDSAGTLLAPYSSLGSPPADATAPRWGKIRVFRS